MFDLVLNLNALDDEKGGIDKLKKEEDEIIE